MAGREGIARRHSIDGGADILSANILLQAGRLRYNKGEDVVAGKMPASQ